MSKVVGEAEMNIAGLFRKARCVAAAVVCTN
jgi:SpoVK/Ycf46/Vps4 family AAA+-type ATPase